MVPSVILIRMEGGVSSCIILQSVEVVAQMVGSDNEGLRYTVTCIFLLKIEDAYKTTLKQMMIQQLDMWWRIY